MGVQERNNLRIKLLPSVVDVEGTFTQGIMFKKAEISYKYDREAQKTTDEKEAIQITATDIATLEDFKVKVPLETEIPKDVKPFTKCTFEGMTGTRVRFDTYLQADRVIFLKEK